MIALMTRRDVLAALSTAAADQARVRLMLSHHKLAKSAVDRPAWHRRRSQPSALPLRHQWWITEISLRQAPSGLAQQLTVRRLVLGQRAAHHCVVAIGRADRPGVTANTNRILTCLHRTRATPQLVAEHADATVGFRKMLQPVNGDRPLRDLRLVVARPALPFLVGI